MDLRGKRVLIMGLGLQGSGMAAARYAAQQGAIVRVTDMKSAEILAPSVRALASLPIEFVLGEHRDEDFLWAESGHSQSRYPTLFPLFATRS